MSTEHRFPAAGAPPGPTITVALTGASGMPYGLRLIQALVTAGARVYLLYSQAAQIVARQELDLPLPARASEAAAWMTERYGAAPGQITGYGREEWFAPVASGSNPPDAMVVCPCTMGTLAAIAGGLSDNLIERAADVVIKEGRKLVLVPRETPYSTLHLENMLRLSRMGVVILPPNPAFYQHPTTIADLVDFVVARIMDQLRIPHAIGPRWGEQRPATPGRMDSQQPSPASLAAAAAGVSVAVSAVQASTATSVPDDL